MEKGGQDRAARVLIAGSGPGPVWPFPKPLGRGDICAGPHGHSRARLKQESGRFRSSGAFKSNFLSTPAQWQLG